MSLNNRSGMTVLELTIVLTLVGMLLTIAVPRTAAARNQLAVQSAAAQLHGDFVRARVDAVRRNTTVTVVKNSATQYTVEHLGVRTLPDGVTFTSATTDQFAFPPFGPSASGAKVFNLQSSGHTKVVKITASGMAKVE